MTLEVVGLVALGFVAAATASALGVGGGVIYVPALVILLSFDQHLAQGTSLAVILPTAVVATVAHARMGNVRWRLALPVAIAGVAGAAFGAWLALRIDADLLSRIFGVFAIALAAGMGWRAYALTARSAPEPDPR